MSKRIAIIIAGMLASLGFAVPANAANVKPAPVRGCVTTVETQWHYSYGRVERDVITTRHCGRSVRVMTVVTVWTFPTKPITF